MLFVDLVSIGPITGAIVGSIVFVAIVVMLAVCFRRYVKQYMLLFVKKNPVFSNTNYPHHEMEQKHQ